MDQNQLFEAIAQHAREVIPALEEHQFTQTDSLAGLGANSMERSEIIMMTLEDLALNSSLVKFSGAKNIGELAELFHEEIKTQA